MNCYSPRHYISKHSLCLCACVTCEVDMRDVSWRPVRSEEEMLTGAPRWRRMLTFLSFSKPERWKGTRSQMMKSMDGKAERVISRIQYQQKNVCLPNWLISASLFILEVCVWVRADLCVRRGWVVRGPPRPELPWLFLRLRPCPWPLGSCCVSASPPAPDAPSLHPPRLCWHPDKQTHTHTHTFFIFFSGKSTQRGLI